MDEARAVMRRLERIETLERERAHPNAVLAELHELVHEAEAWARIERDGRATAAAAALGLLDGEPRLIAGTRYPEPSPGCR